MRHTALIALLILLAAPAQAETRYGEVSQRGEHIYIKAFDGERRLTSIDSEERRVLQAFVDSREKISVGGAEVGDDGFRVDTFPYLTRTQSRYQVSKSGSRWVARPAFGDRYMDLYGEIALLAQSEDRLVNVDGYRTADSLIAVAVEVRPSSWTWSKAKVGDAQAPAGAKTGLITAASKLWAVGADAESGYMLVESADRKRSRGFVKGTDLRWGADPSWRDSMKELSASTHAYSESVVELNKSMRGLATSLESAGETLERANKDLERANKDLGAINRRLREID